MQVYDAADPFGGVPRIVESPVVVAAQQERILQI